MVMGHGHFSSMRLGWSAYGAVCLSLTVRIPRWLGSEFRQRCLLEWCVADGGWTLWCHDVWCPQQGILFLQAGIGREWAKFWVHLSQQVQILKLEYPGRIQPEHMEEMKHDNFYEGLSPKYQWILVHKVDGENSAGYCGLLLAAWKLERRAQAWDPLLPETAVTCGLNVIHSQAPGNLIPSHMQKGNHTFTAWAVTIGNDEGEADSGAKQEGEGETEPLADEEVEVSGRASGIDRLWSISFTLPRQSIYTNRKKVCFWCGSPDHLRWDCPTDISKSAWKADLNAKERMTKKGGQAPQKPAATQWRSPDETPQA